MKLKYTTIENTSISVSAEDMFIEMINIFDSIKHKISFDKLGPDSKIKNLVETVILGSLMLPYEISTNYVKDSDDHIKEIINLLIKIMICCHDDI